MADDGALPRWPQMTAPELTAAYSPSTMVGGDLAPFIEDYITQSAAGYATVGPVQTLTYGRKPAQTIDVAMPLRASGAPLHVFIHGGYWQELSKKESFFAASGTLRQGIGFAALDYTLAPQASIDEIVAEVVAALRHLRAEAETLGADPERIVLSGSSAGAHLAAMACIELDAEEQPAGLILLSGIYDLRPLLNIYVNDALGMTKDDALRNSPNLREISAFPPSVIAWAENDTDEFSRQSRQFARTLQQAGQEVHMLEVASRNHFDIVHDLTGDGTLGQWLSRLAQKQEH